MPPPARLVRTAPSRLAMLLLLSIGYWIGRFASLLPVSELRVADVVVAIGSAITLALWYRRQARRVLAARNARRGR